MVRRLVLAAGLVAALAAPAAAQEERAPHRWSVELVPGARDAGIDGLAGPSLGLRSHVELTRRLNLRLGASHFRDERRNAPGRPFELRNFRALRQWTLEVGLATELNPRGRFVVELVGSAVGVNGRASDAEEWERVTTTTLGWRASAGVRMTMGGRWSWHVRPEIGVQSLTVTHAHFLNLPRPTSEPFPPLELDTTSWDVTVAVGVTLP